MKNKENSEETIVEEKKVSESFSLTKFLKSLVVPLFIGTAALMIIFTLIHTTNLKYKLRSDPLAKAMEITRIVTANNDVEKANIQLSLSEEGLREFQEYKATSPNDFQTLSLIAGEMISHNKSAIKYMDQAKNQGEDIKKLQLVQRLCDSLGEQSKVINEVNSEITPLHDFASKLEDRVEGGEDLEAAMKAVEADLAGAMKW